MRIVVFLSGLLIAASMTVAEAAPASIGGWWHGTGTVGYRGLVDKVRCHARFTKTSGKSFAVTLSEENKRMLWVPPGFAHGFLVTSGSADFLYKTTDYYAPKHERSLLWNDPALAIAWPLDGPPQLKANDLAGKPLSQAETYP